MIVQKQVRPLIVKSATSYYETLGARDLARELKNGSESAAIKMAEGMAHLISPSALLVPLPGRTGSATTSLLLAKQLSKINGAPVYDLIRGDNRASLYDLKKLGVAVDREFFGFQLLNTVADENVTLIDSVCDTGITALSAAALFNHPPKLAVYSSHHIGEREISFPSESIQKSEMAIKSDRLNEWTGNSICQPSSTTLRSR